MIVGLAMRKGGGVREFFIAGGTLPWIMLVPFLMAEYISSATLVGIAEMAHESGVQAMWTSIAAPIGLSAVAFGLVKFYKATKKMTVGENFGLLFGQKTRLISIIMLIIGSSLGVGGACISLGAVLGPMFNIPYESGVWLSTALMAVIALIGLRGMAWMNMVHLFVIIVSTFIGTVLLVNAAGGLGNVMASLPSEHFNLFRPGVPTVVAWFTGSVSIKLISIIAAVAIFAAKDEKSGKIACLSAGAFVFFFGFLPLLIGLSAYVIMPDIPSRLALWEMGAYGGPAVSSLISVGVMAAIISTTPAMLLSISALATRDLFLVIKPGAGERTQMTFSRIFMPVAAFTATWFALTQPTIIELGVRSLQVRVIFGVVLVVSVLWRRIHGTVAFWTLILGGGSGYIWFFAGSPFGIEPMWPGLGIGILTLIFGSLIRKPSPFKGVEGLEIALTTNGG